METGRGQRPGEDSRGIPSRIGHYAIRGVLGEGGMGRVFLAEQEKPRRLVALKVIRPGLVGDEALRRFDREILALGRVRHQGIADIYEAGTAQTDLGLQPFLAMEYVTGKDLVTHAAERRLPVRERLDLMARVCDAVHAAHEAGIVHRDLKPGNILMDEGGHPKVLDFGLARLAEGDPGTADTTTTGRLLGTPQYMSPEQALGRPSDVDRRSDVYSLGVILFQVVAGRMPYSFEGKTIPEVLRTICVEEPTPLSSGAERYGAEVETIVLKALAKEKERRYPSAADLAEDLRRYLRDEPIRARRASTWYQLRKFAARNRALVGGVAAVLVTLVVALAMVTAALAEARRERETTVGLLGEATSLSARSGLWQKAVESSEGAIQGGHGDRVGLRLRQAEAWLALNRAPRASEALREVEAAASPPARALLLRAELTLAFAPGSEEGLALARRALDAGLPPADDAFARSLLAQTVPEAVGHLQATLRADPFHPRANRQLALLQATLARLDEADAHMRAAALLYPEDPAPNLVLAFLRAMEGDETGAQAALEQPARALGKEPVRLLGAAFRATRTMLLHLERSATIPEPTIDDAQPDALAAWVAALEALAPHFRDADPASEGQSLGLAFPVPPVLFRTFAGIHGTFLGIVLGADAATTQALRDLQRTHPLAIFAHLEGYHHFGQARYAEGLPCFREALALPSLTAGLADEARIGGAICCWNVAQGVPEPRDAWKAEAVALARGIRSPDAVDVRALALAAAIAHWGGDLTLARRLLDDCERQAPRHADVLRRRARVELAGGNWRGAVEAADAHRAVQGESDEVAGYRTQALEQARAWLESQR